MWYSAAPVTTVGDFLQVTSNSYLFWILCSALFCLPDIWADNRQDSRIYIVAGNYEQFTALDRYHRAFDADDMEANAVYALRTTLMRELLHTRQELKYFIGGKQRGQRISGDKDFTFEFFHDTCELYVENCYPNIAPDLGQPAGDKGRITYVHNPLYDIHQTIDNIYSTEEQFNPQVRKQLILGLLQLSALLTRLDRFIVFYQQDVWKNKNRLPLGECGDTDNSDYLLFQDSGRGNCLAKLRAEAQKIVKFLRFYRAMIIDNYHLLISPIRYHSFKSRPLYQHIYKELEKVGFPPSDKQLTLNKDFRGLPQPEHFEKEQNLADLMLQEEKKLFQAVAPQINKLIDIALIDALKANSRMLKNLGKEIHYLDGKTKFLRTLICDHRLWKKTRQDFAYLEITIDFDKIQQKLLTDNCQPKQHLLEKIVDVSHWLNGPLLLGLFPAELLFNHTNNAKKIKNLEERLKKASSPDKVDLLTKKIKALKLKDKTTYIRKRFIAPALLVTSLPKTGAEFYQWLKNKPQAIYLGDNFLGNFYDRHSEQELINSLKKQKIGITSDLGRSIIFGLINLVLAGNFFGFHPVRMAKGKIEENWGKLKKIRTARVTARYLATGKTFYSKHPYLDPILHSISRATPFSRQQVNAGFTKFYKTAFDMPNIILGKRQDGYWPVMGRSLASSLMHLGIMEGYLHNWSLDNAKRNIDSIAVDVLSSIFFGVFMSWSIYSSKSYFLKDFFPIFKKVPLRPQQGLSVVPTVNLRQEFFKQTGKTATIGFVGMLGSQALLKSWQHTRSGDSRSWEYIVKMTLFGTLYMAILGNVRMSLLRDIQRRLGEDDASKMFHLIASQANSAAGQWVWIVSKEKYKEQVNISKKSVASADELFLVREVTGKQRTSQLFDFIGNKGNNTELPRQVLNNF